MNYQKLLYYLFAAFIIIVSFFLYSSRFYPLLNSDDAINVLMAHYYQLPNDFYCWGQDRGGTLIPLISQIFIRLFHCSALISVSLSNYIILILGYAGLSSLIKSDFHKIILAIIWFLPFQRFVDLLRFPIGVECSLLGFSIILITWFEKGYILRKWYIKHVLLLLIILVGITAVWVSDLAMVSFTVLVFTLFLYNVFRDKRIIIDRIVLFYLIFGVGLCYLFINYARSFAVVKTPHYLSVNGICEIKHALILIKEAFLEVLTFSTTETVVSVYAYLAILFVVAFVGFGVKQRLFVGIHSNKWVMFFLADLAVVFIVFLLSSWVLKNNMGRWYYVATYISVFMAVILVLDNMAKTSTTKFFRWGILLLALVGAISPLHSMKYVYPQTLKPKVDVLGEFKQLGEIGVIAEYWNSYITACPAPDQIIATSNEESGVKSRKMADMVMARENIYVIKDMWMNTFPDTLKQFGHVLLKDGNPFELGGCSVCKYRKAEYYKSLSSHK